MIAIVAAFYGSTYDFREVTDNRVNSLSTRALVLHGDVDLSRYRLPHRAFARSNGDKLYAVYGVGLSLVAAPIYAASTRLARSEAVVQATVAVPFAAAAVVAMYLLLTRMAERRLALGGAVAFGFGTTLWPLAAMAFFSHGMAALFEICGTAGLLGRTRRAPAIAGLGFGAAVLVRPTTFPFVAAALAFYAVSDRRALGRFAAGLALPAAVVVVQNRWLWGSWLSNGYSLLGVGFHGDVPADLWRLSFGWWRGMFVYSPFLLVAFAGISAAVRRRASHEGKALLALAGGAAATLLVYAGFTTWWGGLAQFGYRYQLDLVAPVVVLAVAGVREYPRLRAAAAGLVALSVLTTTFGAVPKFGAYDNNLFPRAFSDAPVGQAWLVGVQQPLAPALRLAGIGAVAALMGALGRRLQTAVER